MFDNLKYLLCNKKQLNANSNTVLAFSLVVPSWILKNYKLQKELQSFEGLLYDFIL